MKTPTATRSAADYLPANLTLPALRRAAASCEGCELYKRAAQTVFGVGPRDATVMIVGEIPGDEEDRQGKPFVGPAGKLLDRALESAGLNRPDVYMTNVVKHFSWEQRGKRRLHKKPRQVEIVSCRAWIDAELLVVRPKFVVCLGATAAQALLGKSFRVTRQRGEIVQLSTANFDSAANAVATWHPSAILRAPTSERRAEMLEDLTQDLQKSRRLSH
jgi:uracil-DNA glycosylase